MKLYVSFLVSKLFYYYFEGGRGALNVNIARKDITTKWFMWSLYSFLPPHWVVPLHPVSILLL